MGRHTFNTAAVNFVNDMSEKPLSPHTNISTIPGSTNVSDVDTPLRGFRAVNVCL
jgi:hypothetical protein